MHSRSGSVHDSQVTEFGNIHDKLEGVFLLTEAKCCIDSAFGNVSREFQNKLCQDRLGSSVPTRELRKLDLQKKELRRWHGRRPSGECA